MAKKYFIWGLGLLGTSLALALKKNGHSVSGTVRSEKSQKILNDLGFADVFLTKDSSFWEVLKSSDGIIIGTPVEQVFEIIELIKDQALPKHVWITDMASTKTDLMTYIDKQIDPLLFIGSHPMAGSDLTGPSNAKLDLFEKATIYVTPSENMAKLLDEQTYNQAVEDIKAMWQEVGAYPFQVSYQDHDKWAAYLSHGLHLVSCMVSHMLNDIPEVYDVPTTPAGGSFRDITRVAGSNPDLWAGIIDSNHKEVKNYLKGLELLIKDWIFALEKGVLPIAEIFEQSAEIRQKIIDPRKT